MTTKRTRRAGLALALAFATGSALLAQGSALAIASNAPLIGMVCTPGTPGGTVANPTRTFNLVANTGYMATPDGNSIFMWSYANADAPDNGAFQTPGPVLCVTQGEHVFVNLHNTLSDASSVVFPGQTGVAATGGSDGLLTKEALANGNVSYDFTAGMPGTYLYESGSDVSKQVEMGLYGALIVRPTIGASYAYDSTTQFNTGREFLMLLAEIDPDLHHAVDVGQPYDFTTLHNHYYTINGRSFPDTIQDNGSALLPSQPYGAMVRIQPNTGPSDAPALIRMIDVGAQNHPFHPHGNHTTQIAQDGRLLSAPNEHFGETIGAGETEDFLLRWDDPDHWNPNTNPLPVAQPNYRNLTFKDARTWYAGSPYLGYKGTLPTGTTSLNLCGEWYFPLHSHALNEFSNFNEGFGGMGTLLRVDPPGGCFTAPAATKLLAGTLHTGTFTNLGIDDPVRVDLAGKTISDTHIVLDPNITAADSGRTVIFSGAGLTGTRTISAVVPGVSFRVSGGGATSFGTRTASVTLLPTHPVTITSGSRTVLDPAITAAPYVRSVTFAGGGGLGGTRTIGGVVPGVSFTVSGANATASGARTATIRRVDAGVTISDDPARVFDPAVVVGDEGSAVSGAGIPLNSTIMSVDTGSFIMNQNVTASASGIALSIGPKYYRVNSTTTPTPTTDWYAQFSGVTTGSTNVTVTYNGNNASANMVGCCTTTLSLWNWTTSAWVQVSGPTTIGLSDVTMTSPPIAAPAAFIGSGTHVGQVRVRVLTTRTGPTPFVTGGDFMKLVYDAP